MLAARIGCILPPHTMNCDIGAELNTMGDTDKDVPPPPTAVVAVVDKLFKSAPEALMSEGQYRFRTPRGRPSKAVLLEVFSGDFKGKLASWRNATKRKGTPLNQLYRTDELIAIFSNDRGKLFESPKPIVHAARKADFTEFHTYITHQFSNELNDLVLGLDRYRSALVEFYTQSGPDSGLTEGPGGPRTLTNIREMEHPGEPSREFGTSVLMYARYLRSTRRHQMVVELRNKLTHLFHLLGLNSEREEMGRLAVESSTVLKDSASKAETLIDDLGWAVHLQGRTDEAEESIHAALKILENADLPNLEDKVRNYRARSKAYRHLAFLTSTPSRRVLHLNACQSAIDEIKTDDQALTLYEAGILCDEAQLYHAQAYLAARDLGIQQDGTIDKTDQHARQIASDAFDLVSRAVEMFEALGDLERQVKALVLVERLHSALGRHLEAIEAGALREEVLSKSGIDGGMTAITLQKPVTV